MKLKALDLDSPDAQDLIDRFDIPEPLKEMLLQAAHERDRSKWKMSQLVVDFLNDIPRELRKRLRARVIERCAAYMLVERSTAREMLHTAELIPASWTEKYPMLSYSHFARVARCGDRKLARRILDQVTKERDQCPPTCARIDYLVDLYCSRDVNEPIEETETRLKAEKNSRPKIKAMIERVTWHGQDRKVIALPEHADRFAVGDRVLVIRADELEE